MFAAILPAQEPRPTFLPEPAAAPRSIFSPSTDLKPIRPKVPAPGDVRVYAVKQEKDRDQYHLRGSAEIETSEMLLKADEIDFDDSTKIALARGHVRFEHYVNGEKLQADRVEYNVDEETGKFFEVTGTSPAKVDARPGILTTSNPFYFQGKWAERKKDRYILHDGFITDCKVPDTWWIFKGPTFDVIPGDRAISRHSVFYLKGVPLFYSPAFYKSLKKYPRRSGFLTPNIGNSSRRGKMLGIGYYWAINRSYDLQYRNQYFTQRGFAHHVDFRGKVNENTDFGVTVYGVNDRGLKINDTVRKQGGYLASFNGRSELKWGWSARADINYLNSFEFRQNFTESFSEAVQAESHSIAYLTKHWSSFGANIVFDRDQVFQIGTGNVEDSIVIRKLPEIQFLSRERQISEKVLPIWVSFESSAGLLRRQQPLFATREFVDRIDFSPRITTAAYWKGFSLVPAFSLHETHYGSSFDNDGSANGRNLTRHAREFTVDLAMPSIARVFRSPRWMGGEKVKHVVEPRASFRDISGIGDFSKIIRFDETDLFANTRELEVSVANRFYRKRADGLVQEVLSWQVTQRRYFDPTFGGAVVEGRRNVLISSSDLTGYAFIDSPRAYSPIVSQLRYSHKIGLEWRADYDPLRKRMVNSTLAADYRTDHYYMSVGHSQVRNDPVLAPSSNQLTGSFGLGKENKRGWNLGSLAFYDYKKQVLQYLSTQVTYNTDCCGLSVQYRRFGLGTRNENQFRLAFSIANIGSFGTLKRQERLF